MTKLKDDILLLRSSGKSYNQIVEILRCSKGSVSYYCGSSQKEKAKERRLRQHPYMKKMHRFKAPDKYTTKTGIIKSSLKARLYKKIMLFCNADKGRQSVASNISFTLDDIITKFGEKPKCYLTGKSINIYEPSTYHFDHIIPVSRGGVSSLDNLGICTKEANFAKRDLTVDEFVELCRQVVAFAEK